MNVKCWNCHTDFEITNWAQPTSAANSTPISAPIIEQILLTNIFDEKRGDIVAMNVNLLVKEIAQCIADYIEDNNG